MGDSLNASSTAKTLEEDKKKIKANNDANKAVGLMILAIVLLVFLLYICSQL